MSKNKDTPYNLTAIFVSIVLLIVFSYVGLQLYNFIIPKGTTAGPELWNAKGSWELPNDNSIPRSLLLMYEVSKDQHDNFKRIVTKYREEIKAIANPKTSFTPLYEDSGLHIEISSFKIDGAKIELKLREELLKHFTKTQLDEIKAEINFADTFFEFGQYELMIDIIPSLPDEGLYMISVSKYVEGSLKNKIFWKSINSDSIWKQYDYKRQELLLNKTEKSILYDAF